MTDDERVKEKGIMSADDQEFELDPRDSQNLENAMREALEAVEHVSHQDTDEAGTESSGDSSDDEAAALRDRLTRTFADFDNYRKRIEGSVVTINATQLSSR